MQVGSQDQKEQTCAPANDRRRISPQGMEIVVVVPKGPGDWKSASAWFVSQAPPPTNPHPAPFRAMNSMVYVPEATGPTTTLKVPLPLISVVTTPSSTAATLAVTPCRVIGEHAPLFVSVGNWPKVGGNVVQKKWILIWYSLLGVAPTKVNATVNLCVVGLTDHLILLLLKLSGSLKLSQPAVHFCTVAVAEAVPTTRSIATATKTTLFMVITFLVNTPSKQVHCGDGLYHFL